MPTKWIVSLLTMAAALAVAVSVAVAKKASSAVPADPPQTFRPHTTATGGHENSFVPVAPCRIADTRKAGGIVAHASRTFQVTGSSSFATQGGNSAGCAIPAWASSVALSVTAVSGTTTGHVTVYPTGGVQASTTVSFAKNVTVTGSTLVMLGSGGRVNAYVGNTASAHLVIDVTGYYQPAMYAIVNSDASTRSTSRMSVYSHTSTGSYILVADSDINNCAISVGAWSTYRAEGYAAGQYVYVTVTNAGGTAANAYFQVAVTC